MYGKGENFLVFLSRHIVYNDLYAKRSKLKGYKKNQQENKYKCSNGKQKRTKEMEVNVVTFWSSNLQWSLKCEKLEFKARTIEISIN